MARAYPDDLPAHYSSDKLGMVRGWWNGEIGRRTREYTPRVFPGCPAEAIMGFESNAGPRENTTGWITGSADERAAARSSGRRPLGGDMDQRFHELGLFGVEGGMEPGPAPGQVAGEYNNWLPLATSADVRRLLGRAASTAPGSWTSLPDQIAIGMVNVRNAGRSVMRALPAGVRASSEGSLWFIALAFMGWSAGPGGSSGTGGAAGHIRPYAARLAQVAERSRWGAWLYWLALDIVAGRVSTHPAGTHANPAYSATRTMQKLITGRDLAASLGRPTTWFDDCMNVATRLSVQDVLARAAVGQTIGPTVIPYSSLDCAPFYKARGTLLVFGLGAAALAATTAAAWYWSQKQEPLE